MYKQHQDNEAHAAQLASSSPAQARQPKPKSHSEALMDAYGSRATLADIEAAMKAYEDRRPQA